MRAIEWRETSGRIEAWAGDQMIGTLMPAAPSGWLVLEWDRRSTLAPTLNAAKTVLILSARASELGVSQ